MTIDGVAYLGHWPFRELRHNTAKTMLELMVSNEIDIACVSSINAVFYKDVMTGNKELMEEVREYQDRFIPFAVINPEYPHFEEDFNICIDEWNMKGLEIFPGYHGYSPDSKNLAHLLRLAAKKGVPVRLPSRLVDIRGRHRLDTPENLSAQEISDIVSLCSDTDFLLCSCNTANISKLLLNKQRNGKILYDFSRLDIFSYSPSFQALLEAVGESSLFFGSGMPFQYPQAQQVKLHFLSEDKKALLSKEATEKITSGNLMKLIKK